MGSDHYPILCRFGRQSKEEEERIPKYKFAQAKWYEFQERAKYLVDTVDSETTVDVWNASLSSFIHKAALCTIPKKQKPRTRMLVPWWNKECNVVVKDTNRAYRKLRKYPMVDFALECK